MSDAAIQVENLGKRYRIGQRERYLTLRDVLANALKAPLRLFERRAGDAGQPSHIWALKDVNFDVREGEVVGLIGRNGAGKTTLLKILARVTKPTSGSAEIRGRVGSLLEVGTGFHPELTGRENVYLSGAILGMRKKAIDRLFDAIVAFSEVEQFLDTPLKHYSTGMQMRLAFAVAAHLEPEILLIDEVLAVGDIEFQRKCLSKMGDVARGGRTILFVSHQMNQIRRLCQRVFWIDHGQVRASGPAGEIVGAYEAAQMAGEETSGRCFLRWDFADGGNTVRHHLQELTVRLHVQVSEPVFQGHLGLAVQNDANFTVVGWGFDGLQLPPGVHELHVQIPMLPIRPGAYTLLCSLFNRGNNLTGGHLLDLWHAVPALVVETPPLSHPQDQWAGVLNIPAQLRIPEAQAVHTGQLEENS